MSKKYRKKPVVIDAIQWTGDNFADIILFTDCVSKLDSEQDLAIHTLEGIMIASLGDFIIKGIKGEFYPCKPDIFAKTYEKANAKRKPVNGVLNLTGEEIEQLKEMQSIPKENTVTRVEIYCDGIVIKHHTPMMSWRMDEVRRLSTILWLAERFELIKED